MSIFNNGGIAALGGNTTLGGVLASTEDYEEQQALSQDAEEAADDTYAYDAVVADANASVDEAEEMSDEYEADEATLNVAEESLRQWDMINANFENFANTGGMDVKAAICSHQHRLYVLRNLGFAPTSSPNFEGFSEKSKRPTNTRITLEESTSQFRAVLDKVWEFIKKTVEKIVDLVKSWLTATGRTKRRAATLAARAEDAPFGYSLSDKESKRYGRVFWNGSKVVPAPTALKDIQDEMDKLQDSKFPEQTLKVMKDITAGLDPNRRTSLKQIKDVLFSDLFSKETWTRHIGLVNDYHTDIKPDKSIRTKWDKGEGNYYGANILPGGMRLVFFSSDNKANNVAEGVPSIAADFFRFSPANANASMTDKQAPSNAKDVKRICSLVVAICDGREKANQNLKAFATKAKSETEIMDKRLKKIAEKASTTKMRQLIVWFRQLFSAVVRPFEAAARYCVSVCIQALDLCALKMRGAKASG